VYIDEYDDDGKKKQHTTLSWRLLFREIAENYHYTFEEIGNLTYYQIRMLVSERRDLGGRQKVTMDEAQNMGLIPRT